MSEEQLSVHPDVEKALNESIRRRENFWKKYGRLETAALTQLTNPLFRGGPKWPANRQAFLRVDRSKTMVLVSDGLSDPFLDDDTLAKGQGLAIEFYLETNDKDAMGMNWEKLKSHWPFQLVYMVALNAAHGQNFREMIVEHQVLTMELRHINAPAQFLSEEGLVGVMIGGEVKNIVDRSKGPLGDILQVPVTLLTREEIDYAMANGAAGERKLKKLMRKKGHYHLSSTERASVL